MSRIRTDLRATVPRRHSPTKFPPVKTGWGRSPSSTSMGHEHEWATDMVIGLQMKAGSPPKETRQTISPAPREEVTTMKPAKRTSVPNTINVQQIETLKQEVHNLKQQHQGYLDRIAQLEKEIEKLKTKNAAQHKTIENYKTEVKIKNTKISELEEQIKNFQQQKLKSQSHESDNAKEIERLKAALEAKNKQMYDLEEIVRSSAEKMEQMKKEFEDEKQRMQKEFEKNLEESAANFKIEIAEKDEKLNVLKMRMADALKDNSRERQHQLEELTRELKRVTEETDVLRSKIHAAKPTQQTYCQNCPELEKQIQAKILQIRDKDVALVELQRLCNKMEKQLVQQDELLRQWARSKGKDIR
ncbi:ELKS/Rab6-interacting/CAST family member 1 [Nematostella vectensis]|uniref:ELKS/Rab6-interacting/CAST family member 1 n=1 Tax=Nematostella vectensis TaxID=45351 RepID=UPI0013901385|nr:ELKS/Rab6-interacting/CAST family member 1 [Nematostella vectensis]